MRLINVKSEGGGIEVQSVMIDARGLCFSYAYMFGIQKLENGASNLRPKLHRAAPDKIILSNAVCKSIDIHRLSCCQIC